MNPSTSDVLWLMSSAGLVFLMQAGFLFIESGLTRAKNSINCAIKNLADFAVSSLLFWLVSYGVMFGPTSNSFFGAGDFLLNFDPNQPWILAFFLFQMMFCGAAVTILSGACAERIRFPAYLIVATLVAGLVYPVFGHWAWGGLNLG